MDFATFHWRLPQLKINKKRLPHFALLLTRFAFFLPFLLNENCRFLQARNQGILYTGSTANTSTDCLSFTSSSQCPAPFVCVCIAKLISSRLRRSLAQPRRSRSRSRYLSNYLLFLEENQEPERNDDDNGSDGDSDSDSACDSQTDTEAPGLE